MRIETIQPEDIDTITDICILTRSIPHEALTEDLVIRAFFTLPADHPDSPAGYWFSSLWPATDTPEGRAHARQTLANLYEKYGGPRNGWCFKAVDDSNTMTGFIYSFHTMPITQQATEAKTLDRSLYPDDETFEYINALRLARNKRVWNGIKDIEGADNGLFTLKILAVAPEAQSKGVGRLLIKHATSLADDKHAHMDVQTAYERINAMYEKFGFQNKESGVMDVDPDRTGRWNGRPTGWLGMLLREPQ